MLSVPVWLSMSTARRANSVGHGGRVGVEVGVWVTVGVIVGVAVMLGLAVGLSVGVALTLGLGVMVGVVVGVGVPKTSKRLTSVTSAAVNIVSRLASAAGQVLPANVARAAAWRSFSSRRLSQLASPGNWAAAVAHRNTSRAAAQLAGISRTTLLHSRPAT